ncbi:hypothetical protein NO1_0190 [Candidatus Termititenax aidoneus]|uniref:Uncharacterized protein n=1 Tax=Termititenax aidoneus TaxID=2218524 RepID=A0A388T9F9_TERA1|nr:hypothetical protein NO1_0190 [Candidatus Termititenax aidoneus]
MSNKQIIEKQIQDYNSLDITSAERDANNDIIQGKPKLFFELSISMVLITENDKLYNLAEMPTFSRQVIGNGDVGIDELQSTEVYKDAYYNAKTYAVKYNDVILKHYNIKPFV